VLAITDKSGGDGIALWVNEWLDTQRQPRPETTIRHVVAAIASNHGTCDRARI